MNLRRRALHLFLALVVIVPALTAATISSAAANGFPPPISGGTGGGTPGQGGGGTGGGGGSGGGSGGGGGGGYTGPQDGSPWAETRVYWGPGFGGMPNVLDKPGFTSDPRKRTVARGGSCPPATSEGCRTHQSGIWVVTQSQAGFTNRQLQTAASYTALPYPRKVRQTMWCAESVTLSANGPQMNPDFPAQQVNLGTHLAPFAATGRNNMDLCAGPYVASSAYANDKYGFYTATGHGIARQCSRWVYIERSHRTGQIPPPEWIGCSNSTRTVSLNRITWSQSCSHGNEVPGQVRNFTGMGCQQGPPPVQWRCGDAPMQPPIVNGTTNRAPMQIFHDGKNNSVSWGVPAPTGAVSGVRDRRVSLQYVSGTPFRTGLNQADPTQGFQANPHAFGAIVNGWNVASTDPNRAAYNLQFHAAGLPAAKSGGTDANLHRARLNFMFWADFVHQYLAITGFDFSTGRPIYSIQSRMAPASASCPSSTTLLEVLRARIEK